MRKIIVAVTLALAASSCTPAVQGDPARIEEGNVQGDLQYVEIDGMTCLMWTRGYRGGLSCDWDQWEGE